MRQTSERNQPPRPPPAKACCITVKPIITLGGEHEVNEVWLDNVKVPVENRVYEENKGWTCAKFLLAHERTGIDGVARSKRGIERIESALPRVAELPLGGTAAGTGLNAHPEFAGKAIADLSRQVGVDMREAADHFEAQSTQDAVVHLSAATRLLAISLTKICNDLRWMGSGPRAGLGELRLPELQPGSSIMPGKVNPVIPEAVLMVCAKIVGNDAAIAWGGSQGAFELNVQIPLMGTSLLESIRLLANAATVLADKTVDGLVANEDTARFYAEASPSIVTPLNSAIGYENAAKIAKHAVKEGITIRQATIDLGFVDGEQLTEEELDKRLDVLAMARAGLPVGQVREGERVFDLMLRLGGDTGDGGLLGGHFPPFRISSARRVTSAARSSGASSPTQRGSRSARTHSTPQKGRVQTNHATTTAAAATRGQSGWRQRTTPGPRIAGTMTMIQCRWCTHETGERRKPARPTAAASATQSPWRCARWAIQKTTAPMTSSHGAHARVSSVPSSPRRSRVARKAWLAEPSLGPSRVGSDSAPPQKAKEACGSTSQAATETKVAVPIAQPASRQRRPSR